MKIKMASLMVSNQDDEIVYDGPLELDDYGSVVEAEAQ